MSKEYLHNPRRVTGGLVYVFLFGLRIMVLMMDDV